MSLPQLFNVSASTTSAPKLSPSINMPTSPYAPERLYTIPHPRQLVFLARPTNFPSSLSEGDGKDLETEKLLEDFAPAAQPTPFVIQKRQVVVEIEVITIVTVVPKTENPSPVVVTLNVPPPTKTQINQGGWPIINPGSASACWSDYACNSVCPNFQQNGWYAHCMDSGCTQCRCQIISPNMCSGVAWSNATGTYGSGGYYYGSANAQVKLSRKTKFLSFIISLSSLFLA